MNFLTTFITTYLTIAVAELGDKTQILTMCYAGLYPLATVIGAVGLSTGILMAIAVGLGKAINLFIPGYIVTLLSGLIFLVFGILGLVRAEEEEEGEEAGARKSKSAFWFILVSFFTAEFGDRTQLATFAFSAQYTNILAVWLGATLGMISVNISGILIGTWLKKHVSERKIKIAGSVIFIIFGIVTLLKLLK